MPKPRDIVQKQRELFEAIAAEFPLTAFAWGESSGVVFKNPVAEELNKAFFPMQHGKSLDADRDHIRKVLGAKYYLLHLTQDEFKTIGIMNKLQYLIECTLGFLATSISEELKPDYDLFIKKVTSDSRFAAEGKRLKTNQLSPAYLSIIAGSQELYKELRARGVYIGNPLTKIPGFIFLKKIAESKIPQLAAELLNLIQPAHESIEVSDKALFKKLWDEFNIPDLPPWQYLNFTESYAFIDNLQQKMSKLPPYATPIRALHHIMATTTFLFINLPDEYTAKLPRRLDYSAFKARYPQGFATRETILAGTSIQFKELVTFAIYAAEGLKEILEEHLPAIKPLVDEGVIDARSFKKLEQSIKETRELIEKSGIIKELELYKKALDKNKSSPRR